MPLLCFSHDKVIIAILLINNANKTHFVFADYDLYHLQKGEIRVVLYKNQSVCSGLQRRSRPLQRRSILQRNGLRDDYGETEAMAFLRTDVGNFGCIFFRRESLEEFGSVDAKHCKW